MKCYLVERQGATMKVLLDSVGSLVCAGGVGGKHRTKIRLWDTNSKGNCS